MDNEEDFHSIQSLGHKGSPFALPAHNSPSQHVLYFPGRKQSHGYTWHYEVQRRTPINLPLTYHISTPSIFCSCLCIYISRRKKNPENIKLGFLWGESRSESTLESAKMLYPIWMFSFLYDFGKSPQSCLAPSLLIAKSYLFGGNTHGPLTDTVSDLPMCDLCRAPEFGCKKNFSPPYVSNWFLLFDCIG